VAPIEEAKESKTFRELNKDRQDASLKLKKENDRILRSKSKPRGPKQTFESARKKAKIAQRELNKYRRGARGR
jgi:hypothetical protein